MKKMRMRKTDSMMNLTAIYDACPKHDIKIVIGDMNAQVGKEQIYQQLGGMDFTRNHMTLGEE
jgi:hypothetical protein